MILDLSRPDAKLAMMPETECILAPSNIDPNDLTLTEVVVDDNAARQVVGAFRDDRGSVWSICAVKMTLDYAVEQAHALVLIPSKRPGPNGGPVWRGAKILGAFDVQEVGSGSR